MTRMPLLIDCDPGVDDAVALALTLAARRRFDLLGVVAVAGNLPLATTARNARFVCDLAGGADVRVLAGAARPLRRAPHLADAFHGAHGLGDMPAPEGTGAVPADGIGFMADTLARAVPASVTLAVLGPLTNLATVLGQRPDAARGVREVVVMGGARSEGGNVTASAEYNLYADPEAAAAVLGAGLPVSMIGLDVTHKVRAGAEVVARLQASGRPGARLAARLIAWSNTLPGNLDHGGAAAPLHDPCVIASLLAPGAFVWRPATIRVESDSELTRGHSAVEFRADEAGPFNARWATDVDSAAVLSLLAEELAG